MSALAAPDEPMGFRLPFSPLDQALRKAALSEVDGARRLTRRPSDRSIHELRKHCKRLRAWSLLLRPCLGRAQLHALEDALRQASAQVAGLRDARVLRLSLSQLLKLGRAAQPPPGAWPARRMRVLCGAAATADERAAAAAAALAALDTARRELLELPLGDMDAGKLEQGLRRCFRSARQRYATAQKEGCAEALHDWRKRSKALAYQCALLRPLWPQLAAWEQALDGVNEALGRHHDLSLLLGRLDPRDPLLESWRGLALHEQEICGRQALVAGAEVYSERRLNPARAPRSPA